MKRFCSAVITGHGRGKLLGYPTFNLMIPEGFELEFGIYAAWVWLPSASEDKRDLSAAVEMTKEGIEMTEDAHSRSVKTAAVEMTKEGIEMTEDAHSRSVKKYMGAMHYGPVPVFDQPEPTLEIFVLDWEDDGQSIELLNFSVGPYLREVRGFDSPEALAGQIGRDVARVREVLESKP